MRKLIFILSLFTGLVFLQGLRPPQQDFKAFMQRFHEGYAALGVPYFEFDYRSNFSHIKPENELLKQQKFFEKLKEELKTFDPKKFSRMDQLHYDHLGWQVELNLQRIQLEQQYVKNNKNAIPDNGLSSLDKNWYSYYTRFYTSVKITPEDLFKFGEQEVKRVQAEIRKIRGEMGYASDSAGFYRYINSNALLLTNKDSIVNRYEKIKTIACKNLGVLFEDTKVDHVLFMEWPGADKYTPPGYYSPAADNAFNKGIYYYNFSNGKHNVRAMDWLFMHEGVPGHHYQWYMKYKIKNKPAFIDDFYYSGNFEGWGAYVEYLGKDIGLYKTHEAHFGKWEWDLVRSVRIMIDVGIHHYGWTKEEALACWKKHVPNQDEIAEREVLRCTNWPAQALSYKVGADRIMKMRDRLKAQDKKFSIKKFHSAYLAMGSAPVEAMEKNIETFMK